MSEIKRLRKMADKIYAKMENMQRLSDSELKSKTDEFKLRLANGETLEQILPDAYAAVGEAAYRSIGLRPYKVQIMGAIALNEGKIAEQKTGEGKSCSLNTPIPTPEGWKTAGCIKVGDVMFGRDGKPTKVLGVYPQGKKQIYEVHLSDGRMVEVADEHLWSVYQAGRKGLQTLNTVDMLNKGLRAGRAYRFRLPMNAAVEYQEADLPLNPYVLGAFLGNGCKDPQHALSLSSGNEFVPNEIAKIIGCRTRKRKNAHTWYFYKEDDSRFLSKAYPDEYDSLLTQTKCGDKYIPDIYKTASIEQRWALLQGLFDTDGCIEDKDRFHLTYSTTSAKLRDDICEVIYSLGMNCSWWLSRKAGVRTAKSDQYTINVNIDNDMKKNFFRYPFKLERALMAEKAKKKRKRYDRIAIKDIVKKEEETEMVCFTVDNDEHLFLCGNYVVTHNTLVAALPAYLNALEEKGIHVVTVNDYLAKRDAEDIGRIHKFMGLSVGCILKSTSQEEKKKEYAKDITYITNTELGFDYLRDNMAQRLEDKVQRGFHYCIIDEVDSVLIDEARTPLIISGVSGKSTKLYTACNELVKTLEKGELQELSKVDLLSGERPEETGDYTVDEEHHTVTLTLQGIEKCEKFFGIDNLADKSHTELMHNIIAALKAHNLMKKDKDYVVKNGEVMIVDSFTGRIMPGRRYSDGLHQAIEAKEGCEVQEETCTYATVTYQNFFNKYDKKCGMTGTAYTERKEFKDIYHMDVVRIPTNKPVQRQDKVDRMYLTKEAKFKAVLKEIQKAHISGQPVLVGTSTIRDSETLDKMLNEAGLEHTVLNAKFHEQEAEIVAKAGQHGAITIATNMAGRGTDIKLDDDARAVGGLKVIGTQRHESRRIDNQLKGRSGRQGDPGESVFYLSLDDDVLRLYGSDRMKNILTMTGMKSEDSIENRTVNKFVKKAQNVIEDNNFGTRKSVLKYDKVNNEQRELIYAERDAILEKADTRNTMLSMIEDSIDMIIDKYASDKYVTDGQYQEIRKEISVLIFGIKAPEYCPKNTKKGMNKKKLAEEYIEAAKNRYYEREREWPDIEVFREFERQIILRCIDSKWMQHINDLEILRQNISLVGYGQKDPAIIYKLKAFDMFNKMSDDIKNDAVYTLFSSRLRTAAPKRNTAA